MSIGPSMPLRLEKPEGIDLAQAARYFGARGGADTATQALLEKCAVPLLAAATPRAVWLEADPDSLTAAGILAGEDVAKHLEGCTAALLLAVTLGPGVDAQIRRAGVGDIAAGVASDALGSALAEQAAEAAEAELRQWAARQGKYLTGRYSPGYGDWPLAVQPLLAAALDTARRAGLCVTENNLMTPARASRPFWGSAITRSGGIWQDAGTACSAPGANIERGGSPVQANELFDRPNTILLDGGMGTMLQAAGLKLGARPEELNITDPALIESIHARYAAAGSRIINANTFGASAHKLAGSEYTLEEIIAAGIANCKRACAPYGALAALDVGPLGELLEPNGTLAFEDAVAEYGRIVRAGVAAGADLVFLETFTDLYELKAALLAVKENSSLPVLASMSFEAGGRTFTGCTVESFAATARGLGADAVGINCSLGPKEIFSMAKRLTEALPGSFPVFVKPNAGLPRADGSGYDITPQLYAMQMKPYRELGLFAAGGCCGTTPEFIQLLNGVFADCRPGRADHPMKSVVCSPMDCVDVDGITVVGERINPTGKKRFQQALREGDMNYVLEQAVSQTEAGAQILDVNVGAPGVDEPALMEQVVKALQSVVSLPLQLDSSHAEALERGLRVYNGKPIVNSVNGEAEKLNTILPLCKKYGAAVVGLAIDERGILPKAEDRVAIARRIRNAALAAGIPQEDIYIDCLTLTASAQQEDVLATVQALHACKEELGVRTILGVSNISFGLPCRSYLNTTFLTMAMYAGLDLAIMNPSSEEMMAAVYAYNVLTNRDRQSTKYIERYANRVPASAALVQAVQNAQTAPAAGETPEAVGPYAPLMKAVEKGLKGEAAARTRALLEEKEPLELVDEALIPALDIVGAKYEKGTLFLPQLLQAATAAQGAFEEIKTAIAQKGEGSASKGRIVIATVKGDVHDIGKNIVRVILENYGFEVIDLGRDVPVETVVNTVREKDVHLVGLSALMTTTLKSMEETIRALHDAKLDCKIMVGGAVLTPEYAKKIGADWYAKDAKQSADIAKEFFGG